MTSRAAFGWRRRGREATRRARWPLVVACLLLAWTALAPPPTSAAAQGGREPGAAPARIVSLVPAASEILFEIGAGPRVAGVGSYDRVPDAFRGLPRVGGLLDPNVERILSMKPDLVIVYANQSALIERLSRARIRLYSYRDRALSDVAQTVRALGARVGLAASASAAATGMERRLAAVQAAVSKRAHPRTLLVFGREPGALRQIRASGGFGFLHDLLEIAGGVDVMRDVPRESVEMSTEMVLTRAPEVIIELRYGQSTHSEAEADQKRVWSALASLPAVRTGRIYLLTGDEFVVPGPRLALVAERFAQVLHPGAGP